MRVCFANCLLDLATRELWRDGQLAHLTPKAYTLLEALVRARPGVVTRPELDELLWPRSFVARSSLGRLVTELRAAIGDDAREPCVIRTLHGVGFRFCATVTQAPSPASTVLFALVWRDRPFPLEEGEHLLGREPDCRIIVDVAGVSRHHARIDIAGQSARIADLVSKNGTFVNRRRIDGPVALEHLDEVGVGTAVLTVRRLSASATTQTVYRP